jgi:hypothetical protein
LKEAAKVAEKEAEKAAAGAEKEKIETESAY